MLTYHVPEISIINGLLATNKSLSKVLTKKSSKMTSKTITSTMRR